MTRRLAWPVPDRLNNIIRAWEEGRPALASFAHADRQTPIEFNTAPYDGVVFEMEHNPSDVQGLEDALQYLLNRKQIATSGSPAPAVTPMVRIPANEPFRLYLPVLVAVPRDWRAAAGDGHIGCGSG